MAKKRLPRSPDTIDPETALDGEYQAIKQYYIYACANREKAPSCKFIMKTYPDVDVDELARVIELENWEGQWRGQHLNAEREKIAVFETFVKQRGTTEAKVVVEAYTSLAGQGALMVPKLMDEIHDRLTNRPETIDNKELVAMLNGLNRAMISAARLAQYERMAGHKIGLDEYKRASAAMDDEKYDTSELEILKRLGLAGFVQQALEMRGNHGKLTPQLAARIDTPTDDDFDYKSVSIEAEFTELEDDEEEA